MKKHTKHTDSLAARLRRCPNKVFWARGSGRRTPDYNGVLLWYLQSFLTPTGAGVLLDAGAPKLPSFCRAVASESERRKSGGTVEKACRQS